MGLVLGALLFAGALADGGQEAWIGLVAGPLCAALGWLAVGGLVERARGRLEPDQAALLTAYADGAALILAAIAIFVPPLALLAIPGFVVLLLGGRAPRGREVRRACGSFGSGAPKKLVLAVIDSLKPDMLDQAIAEGQAPALAALRDRGTYVRDCVSTFPSVTPVASAAIATGCGPGEHHIPSMNWYHRGEERYVEYGSSFPATRAFGVVRSLYDTVYNMNMAHLTRAPQDRVRAPRRRRAAHRLHDLPDLPRPHPPRPVRCERLPPHRRGGPVPPPGLRRARALLRRPVRLARHRLHVGARHAGPARPPHRLRRRLPGRARPLRLPAVLAARQRHLLAQGRARTARCARSRRPTGRSSGSCTWPAASMRSSRSTR